MGKLVILNLSEGNFDLGFTAILEIGQEALRPEIVVRGHLPGASHIPQLVDQWQAAFSKKVSPPSNDTSGNRSRATPRRQSKSSCKDSAEKLVFSLNEWLNSGNTEWQKIRDGLQQNLLKNEEIRVIIQTQNNDLRQLPWQAWDLFTNDYRKAEIALSEPEYYCPVKRSLTANKVRIIAVLGNSDGIDIQFDRQIFERLNPDEAECNFLEQPTKKHLIECLSDPQGWHILFFAGHSYSVDGKIGIFEINSDESIQIDELKNTLKLAISHGLQLAIFNSCDGLGLANQLAQLQIPQSIVMREPVPDRVAQDFLQYFLTDFAGNRSFYASVLSARRKLEDIWNQEYCGISWLPVICQNPAVEPLMWKQLLNWKCLHTLTDHSDIVKSVAISPNQNIIASGSLDQTIKLWNLATGELLHTFTGHRSAVIDVAFSPDGKTLASASNHEFFDGSIKLWDVANKQFKQSLGNTLVALRTSCLAFSPDEQTLANGHIGTTLMGGTIDIWNLRRSRIEKTLWGHVWEVNCLAFSKDGRILVSGSLDGAVKIWNWHRKELLHTLIRPVDFFGALASWFDSSVGIIWCVAISPDGKTVAASGSQQPIQLWNTENGKLLRTFTEHSDSIYALAFSPDGETLASGGADNTIRIWNFHTGELLETLEHLGPVKSVVFSYDGKILVSGSADATVKIWRVPV